VALEWMLDEAEPRGLMVDAAKRHTVLGGVVPSVPPGLPPLPTPENPQ
jgi:hypothetical protein